MKLCPRCKASTRESERVERDRKSKKNWLITFCAKCAYNYEIQEYTDKVTSPEEEMDKFQWPPAQQKGYWL